MTPPVSLQLILDEMETQSEMVRSYVHRPTGRVISDMDSEAVWINDYRDPAAESVEMEVPTVEEIAESEDFIPVPDSFDIHEWSIMERFSQGQSDPDIADRLLGAIHGGGAFRRFKDAVYELDIDQQWYRFRVSCFVKRRSWKLPFVFSKTTIFLISETS